MHDFLNAISCPAGFVASVLLTGWLVGLQAEAAPPKAEARIVILPCVERGDYHTCARITVSGDLGVDDGDIFVARTKGIDLAAVSLSGLGGSLLASIQIGERIAAAHWVTWVAAGKECDSGCAVAWIAGRPHGMGVGAVVGFHAPYNRLDPDHADGTASAVIGAYLAGVGIPVEEIVNLIGHGPHDYRVVDSSGKIWETGE
jgi:hypothetical protein